MVQAFGREDDVRERFGAKASLGPRHRRCSRPASRPSTCPALFFLPTLSIAAVVFFGGRDVIDGDLTIGQFVLFNTILLQLAWPLEALGWILNLAQRALASAGPHVRLARGLVQRLPEPEHAAEPCPPARSRSRFEGVHFAYPDEEEVLTGVDLELDAGRDRGRVRRHRLRQEHAPEPGCRASTTRPQGACCWAASTCATCRLRTCARPSPSSPSGRSCSRSPCARTSSPAGRTRDWDEVEAMCDAAGVADVRRRPPERLRHADRRARREPLRRPAPAGGAGPRADCGHARDRDRRPALGRRHAHGARPASAGCVPRSRAAP